MRSASPYKSFILEHNLDAVMRRPVHITVDGDDKQGAAADSTGGIKKGLDVL